MSLGKKTYFLRAIPCPQRLRGNPPAANANRSADTSKKVGNMCECVSKINEKLREYNTFIPSVIFFSGIPSRPEIVVEKLDKSKKGKAQLVMLRYCPFCGKEYAAEQGLHTDAGKSADLQAVSNASTESTSQAVA